MEISYKVIGRIHSEFKNKDHTPIQSVFSSSEGTVEIFPEYTQGLKDIEGFSHLILIYHFDRVGECTLTQKPFLDGSKERGIFAIRHCNRPNPIGISIVELRGVENNLLKVRGIDALDGTPLLDIKPYVRQFDHRENVRSGWVDEQSPEAARKKVFTPDGLKIRDQN